MVISNTLAYIKTVFPIRQRVGIDVVQFGFMLGRGTTDMIFILHQIQETHLAANYLYRPTLHCFCGPGEVFDGVPRDVMCALFWARAQHPTSDTEDASSCKQTTLYCFCGPGEVLDCVPEMSCLLGNAQAGNG